MWQKMGIQRAGKEEVGCGNEKRLHFQQKLHNNEWQIEMSAVIVPFP